MISLFCGGFISLGFTAFFEPIVNEFGWSYAQVSLATSFRGAEVGLIAPIIGLLVDRYGPRRLMFLGIVIIGTGLILMSRTASLAMFYGSFIVVAIGVSGISYTVLAASVANWFRRKIGIATGIMFSGFACGGMLVPLVVSLIDMHGWRFAAIILCLVFWIIGLPITMVVRHKPEQYGYLPDGEQSTSIEVSEKVSNRVNSEIHISAKQALKTRAFWHIAGSLALNYVAISAVIIHIMPYLSSIGIARSDSSLVAMVVPLVSITGRISCGWLSDRFNKAKVAALFMVSCCIGVLLFSFTHVIGIRFLILFALLYGIGWGGVSTIRTALMVEYFGRSAFGSIIGLSMGLTALGQIIGPFIAGWIFDIYGSYQLAWLLYAGLILAALIVIISIPRKAINQFGDFEVIKKPGSIIKTAIRYK